MFGLGALNLYCILHFVLSLVVFVKDFGFSKSELRQMLQVLSLIFYGLISFIPPIAFFLWLSMKWSLWEWIGVMSLLAYFFPFVVEFTDLGSETDLLEPILSPQE